MSTLESSVDLHQNINIETVENCNLLCKLIIDYLPSDECKIEKTPDGFRIIYPPDSFINYRDTSYELTYAYFYYPSRHSIDGQKYDLEVNIYHGIFTNIDGEKEGGKQMHTHYHEDTDEVNQHKHFHYHLENDANEPHIISDNDKNIVTCLLFNKGEHIGSDVNIFFNQFVHSKGFKNFKGETSDETTITVHDGWSIEKILPKKRSFFMYDSINISPQIKNTIIVFDTVQTISKEIIDRLYQRGIKDTTLDLTKEESFSIKTPSRVFYRKNVELITDATYKKTKRAQIKDLISLTRMSNYIPSKKTSKEYNTMADEIIKDFSGGTNTGYLTSEEKAKRVADNWKIYGEDNHVKKSWEDLGNTPVTDIIFNSDVVIEEKYLEKLLETFKNTGTTLESDFNQQNIFEYYFDKDNLDEYIKDKKEVNNYLKEYYKKIIENKADYFNDKSLFDFYDIVYEYPEDQEEDRTVPSGDRTDRRDELQPYGKKLDNFYNCIIGNGVVNECVVTNEKGWGRDLGKTRKDIGDFKEKINNLNLDDILKNGLPENNLFKLCILTGECEDENSIYKKKMQLRFLFEDLDIIWQTKNDCKSSFYSLIHEYNKNNGPDNNKTRDDLKTLFDEFDEEEFVTLKKNIIFHIRGKSLTRTLSNEECQHWLSNEVHYEGDLLKFWEKPVKMGKTDKETFSKMSTELKEKIGEGLLEYDKVTANWTTHNKCRNPGNKGAAPWCYTKNPNKRWEYCQTPYYSNILGKIVLFLVFIFIGVIAFYTIKTLFFHEYPMQFVAKLTGGKLASKDTFSDTTNSVAKK